MPPVSSVDTELVTRSPAGRWVVRIRPERGAMVPTTPCSVKNQMRPLQSGIVAMRQSSTGTAPTSDHECSLAIEPSACTATFQISRPAVVG